MYLHVHYALFLLEVEMLHVLNLSIHLQSKRVPLFGAELRSVTIFLSLLQCTHVVEYARDTYSRTGSSLLDSIAIVHPFTISTLLSRATTPSGSIREVCTVYQCLTVV